jgi:hypothetical protein
MCGAPGPLLLLPSIQGLNLSLELFQTILGFLSIVVSTVAGVTALLVEYRDKETGKITKWGRYALIGLATSFLIGGINLSVDYIKKTRESRETAQKTLRIVTEIDRTLNPLKDVRLGFWILYPFDQPELSLYRDRMNRGIIRILPDLQNPKLDLVDGVLANRMDMQGHVLEVQISNDSSLFPNNKTERFAHTVLSDTIVELRFYRKPITFDEFQSVDGPAPDIDMMFEPKARDEYQLTAEYELATQKIRARGSNVPTDSKFWRSSGKIASVLDLPGSQLFITAGHTLVSFTERDKRVQPSLESIVVNVAERRGWWIPVTKAKHYTDLSGRPVYVYEFPNTFDDLLKELEK